MSFRAIARSLGVNPVRNTKAIEEKNKISNGVNKRTVMRAYKYINRQEVK